MPNASNLAELFEVREHSRATLDAITNVTGTALGRKNSDGDPAVLVFVRRKIGLPWLPTAQVVPERLTGPRGLECPTDVVSIETDRELWLPIFEDDQGSRPRGHASLASLVDTDLLEGGNLELRDRLRGAGDKLTIGSQLANPADFGTLACIAQDRKTGDLGFLTNMHVAAAVGDPLHHPDLGHRQVGTTLRGEVQRSITEMYGVPIPASTIGMVLTVDAAFCKFSPQIDEALLDPRLPILKGHRIVPRPLGQPRPLDPTTMWPVGEKVVGVGRTRGFQQGCVAAVAFDVLDPNGTRREITELLIVGENGDEFSDPGDSGKLVVTADGFEPLAIMWGGFWTRQRHGHDLENFTSATDIGRILQILDVEIVRTLP
jgi:hypothetical protein